MSRALLLFAALLLLACDQTSTSERIGVTAMSYCAAALSCTSVPMCESQVFDDGQEIYDMDPMCLPLWEALLECGETLPCSERHNPYGASGCANAASALDACTP